jgi:hypothetical protein
MSKPERYARITAVKALLENPATTLEDLQSAQEHITDGDAELNQVLNVAIAAFNETNKSSAFGTLIRLLNVKSNAQRMQHTIEDTIADLADQIDD